MKFFLILFLNLLLISCSNLDTQKYNKKDITLFNKNIETNLKENNFDYIEKNIKRSLKNDYILSLIKKIDFTKTNIFISDPRLREEDNKIYSIIAINYIDRTIYFDIFYGFYNNRLFITEIKERG